MIQIRCGSDVAVDLDEVIAWKKLKLLSSPEGTEILKLYFAGNSSDFSIASSAIGREAFDRLHELLINRFTIDLAVKVQRQETIDDYAGEAILDRYVDPEELNIDR